MKSVYVNIFRPRVKKLPIDFLNLGNDSYLCLYLEGFQDSVQTEKCRGMGDVFISLDYNELIKRQKQNHFCAVPAEVKVQVALCQKMQLCNSDDLDLSQPIHFSQCLK